MKDRVPLYPGRVKMVPVAGQENVYNMTRADQPTQEGDPLNKATLLKDATAALFGLGADSVPDDALAYVGKYAQHWWKRRTFEATKIDFGPVEQIRVSWGAYSPETRDVPYSEEINIFGSVAKLKDQKTLSVSYSTYTEANKLKGKYFYEYGTENVCYVEPSAPDATKSGSYDVYISAKKVQKATPGYPTGDWEYLQSSDRSAYPDSGEQGGYEYQYLGIPFDNAVTTQKIATGSYVGTGKYGADNPNSLTFEFEPKMVFVIGGNYTILGAFSSSVLSKGISIDAFGAGSIDGLTVSWSGSTVTWYHSGEADAQLNDENSGYEYLAIG